MSVNIAIDGPAGAGKSTVARRVAARLGLCYLDTGAMYRAVTYMVLKTGANPEDEAAILHLSHQMEFGLDEMSRLTLDGNILGDEVRTPEVSRLVSQVSSHPRVRQSIVSKQQQLARRGGIVMDGRDIGTTVMVNAELKIFLTAELMERARRRAIELEAAGYSIDIEELARQMDERDTYDSNRAASPLRPADDAIILDTTNLSLDQVVDRIVMTLDEKIGVIK